MNSFKLIKPYLVANRYRIFFGLLCLIIVDLLQLFIPRVIKRVVDDLTLIQVDRSGLLKYALIIVALGLCIGFFRFFWRRCLLGTARMGDDPAASVVDRYHRSHDVSNLFICDGSSFVTSGRGQPTMTIMALAFRAAEHIAAAAQANKI